MPTKSNNVSKITPIYYGKSTGYDWVNNPFVNPLERKSVVDKRVENRRKYKKRKPKYSRD